MQIICSSTTLFVVVLTLSSTSAAAQESWSWSKLNPFANSQKQSTPAQRTAMVDGSPLVGALSKPVDLGSTAVRRVRTGTSRAIDGASAVMPWNWREKSEKSRSPWALGSHASRREPASSSSWFPWFQPTPTNDGPRTPKEFLDQERPNWGS